MSSSSPRNASAEVRAFVANLLDVEGMPGKLPESPCEEELKWVAHGLQMSAFVASTLVVESLGDLKGPRTMASFYVRESAPLTGEQVAVLRAAQRKRSGLRKWLEGEGESESEGEGEGEGNGEEEEEDEDESEGEGEESGSGSSDGDIASSSNDKSTNNHKNDNTGGNNGNSNGDDDSNQTPAPKLTNWRARYVGVSIAGTPYQRLKKDLAAGSGYTRFLRCKRLVSR